MKKITNKVLPFMIGIITVVSAMVSCKSGTNTNEQAVDSIQAKITADSITLVHEDSVKKALVAQGTAKPNPAKIHGKGMVVFQTDLEKEYEQQYAKAAIEMKYGQNIAAHVMVKPAWVMDLKRPN